MVARYGILKEQVVYVRPRPEHRPRKSSGLRWLGCGCGAALAMLALLTLVVVAVVLPNLPNLLAGIAGMTAQGRTADIFVETPQPAVQLQNASAPAQVTLNLGQYGGVQTLANNSPYFDLAVGTDPTGAGTAVITFTEAGLNEACRQQVQMCAGADPNIRNVRIDLRPGGAVIYGDVSIPTPYGFTLDDTVGVVLQTAASRRNFQVVGMDWRGTLYDRPPQEFEGTIRELERTANDLVDQLTLDAGAGAMTLSEIVVDDTTLTLVMR
jgi:hypothetical protein